MADELPPPRLSLLTPTPDSFERVVRRARKRRYVATARLVAVLGVVGLGAAALVVHDPGRDAVDVVADPDETTTTSRVTTSTSAVTTSTTAAPATEEATTTTSTTPSSSTPPSTPTPSTMPLEPEGECGCGAPEYFHRGVAVDPLGNPLAGIHVYEVGAFYYRHVAITAADGSYELSCTGAAVVLYGGHIVEGNIADTSPAANWAPAAVGGGTEVAAMSPPACVGPDEPSVVTTMQPGVIVTGIAHGPDGEPLRNAYDYGLNVTGQLSAMFGDLALGVSSTDGDGRFWAVGLPAGEVRLVHFMYAPTSAEFTAASGEMVTVDWYTDRTEMPGTPP